MRIHTHSKPVRQQGAALLVAMVLIFMLAILGTASMRDATLENQLAANAVQKELTFQSAESATDMVLAITSTTDDKALEKIICQDTESTFDMPEVNAATGQTTEVSLRYHGQSLPVGWSLGGAVGGRRFSVTGESALTDAHTSTRISQGVLAIGAVQQGVDC